MTTFKLDLNADTNGTSLQSYVDTNYADLHKLFGEPQGCDGYKVSGEWTFVDPKGNVVTLYDWKSTSLYDSDYPSIETFRASPRATFNIGGNSPEAAINFSNWLHTKLSA